jgi:hypothetical protein
MMTANPFRLMVAVNSNLASVKPHVSKPVRGELTTLALSLVSVAVQTVAAWLSQLAPSCYVVFKAGEVVVLDMAAGKGSDGTYSGLASLTSRAAASSCARA